MRHPRWITASCLALSCIGGCASDGDTPADAPRPVAVEIVRKDVVEIDDPEGLTKVIGRLPAMAQPVVVWLHAVKYQKPEILKRVFSTRVRALPDFKNRTWEEICADYGRRWREKFGDWKPADFHFQGTVQLEGKPPRGVVPVSFEPPGGAPRTAQVRVVREGDAWYVDER
jgi:hypothetical protein